MFLDEIGIYGWGSIEPLILSAILCGPLGSPDRGYRDQQDRRSQDHRRGGARAGDQF